MANNTFKSLWLSEQLRRIKMVPELSSIPIEKVKKYLLEIYDKRRVVEGRFYNNTDNSNYKLNQEQFIDMYLNKSYITTRICMFL